MLGPRSSRIRGYAAALVAVAAFTAVAAVSTAATPSAAGVDPTPVGFGVSPVEADGDRVGDRALFSFGLPPGGTAEDRVAVLNYAATPLTFQLYAADALNAADGSFALTDGQSTPRDLGGWITLGSADRSVVVPGRTPDGQPGKLVVPVRIAVPAGASPGDHGAGIVASLTSLGRNPQSQNIKLEQRVATRVYVRVAGIARPGLQVVSATPTYLPPTLPWRPGGLVVDYEIVNTGNIRLGYAASMTVRGPFGVGERTVDLPDVPELLPHQGQNASVTVPDVWPWGLTTVTVVATPKAAVAAADPGLGPVEKSESVWAVAWWWWLVLLAGLLLLVLLLLRLRGGRLGRWTGRGIGGVRRRVPTRPPGTHRERVASSMRD